VADAAMRRMFPAPFIAANPRVVAGRRAVFERIDPGVFASACRMLAALDCSEELPRIKNPTLIVVAPSTRRRRRRSGARSLPAWRTRS
jgi:hypothetical protein